MAIAIAMNNSSPTNVFEIGNYSTKLITVEPKSCYNNNSSSMPPKPLLIATPEQQGIFPVLVFLHGFLLYNNFYSQLLQHIASHGFIVVAPQLYCVAGVNANEEIKVTTDVVNWLSEGLSNFLPPSVHPNLKKLGLAGHSRGGKVAFALSLTKPRPTSLNFSALIGIDPVDGMDLGKQTPPPVLTYTPNSFDLGGIAALVIGSGFGELKKNYFFPPCAPKGVNHEDFYNECCKPAHYFVAKNCGHLDMLDDDTKGIRGIATYLLCKNGESREPMRRFVGGVVVAFLKAYLEGDLRELMSIKSDHEMLPVVLQKVEFKV